MLYLTVFAAFRLYRVLAGSSAGTVVPDRILPAAWPHGTHSRWPRRSSGGFALILASTGTGSHVMLFSYYVILNVGLLGIAWFQARRPLNVLGFLLTFGIGTPWGGASTVLTVPSTSRSGDFLFTYLAIPILFARRRDLPKNYVDGTLVFGTPLVAFGLQTQLVRNRIRRRVSAVALAFVYLSLALVPYSPPRRTAHAGGGLPRAGVVFGTLAILLALDGR